MIESSRLEQLEKSPVAAQSSICNSPSPKSSPLRTHNSMSNVNALGRSAAKSKLKGFGSKSKAMLAPQTRHN